MLVLALVAVASLAEAGVGDMDPRYGVNGRFEARRYGEYFVYPSLADGRVLYPADGGYRRTDSSGLPDAAFGVGGVQPWPEGYAATGTGGWARTRDGRLLVALHRQAPNGTAYAVLKLGLDGTPDPAFGANGLVTIDVPPNGTRSAQSLLVQLDGKLLLLLARHHPDDYYSLIDPLLIRLMPDGRLDPDFGSGGIVDITLGFHEHIDAMDGLGLSLLADGRIVVWTSPATYLEESGAPASAPPAGAELWSVAALLPDGGAIAWANTSAGPMIAKVREDGSFDGTFGPNWDGTVRLSPSSGARGYVWGASVSSDGRHIYASWGAESSGGPLVSRFFASGPMAGRLDASFGKQGIVALKSGHAGGAIRGLADGGAIVTTADYAYRLLGRADPSPGYTGRSDSGPWSWLEGRDVELRVFRAAGSDGAIRLRFWTLAPAELPEGATSPATPGEDFEAVSGVLDWSDGDDADKVIRIPLRRDNADEGTEQIYVGFEALTPGSWNATPLVAVAVGDATVASSAGNPPAQAGSRSGGGAFGWPGLLLLAAAAIAGRLRLTPRAGRRTRGATGRLSACCSLELPHPEQPRASGTLPGLFRQASCIDPAAVPRMVSTARRPSGRALAKRSRAMSVPTLSLNSMEVPAARGPAGGVSRPRRLLRSVAVLCLLTVASLAEAGIGDMDPTFGINGRFGGPSYPPLADGRLLYLVEEGYRRTDPDGRPDSSFGSNGVQRWPDGMVPKWSNYYGESSWARDRDGRLLVLLAAPPRDGNGLAVLRLGHDGEPDPAFGSNGLATIDDPTYSGPDTVALLQVQPDGRLLLQLGRAHPTEDWCCHQLKLIRLLPDGRLDASFGDGGSVSVDTKPFDPSDGWEVSFLIDGRMLVPSVPATCLTASGVPTDCAPAADATQWRIAALLADGSGIATTRDGRLAKVRSDGSFDETFGPNSDGTVTLVTDEPVNLFHLSASQDGRYLYVLLHSESFAWRVIRLFADGDRAGRPDVNFGQQGAVALKSDSAAGRIYGLADGRAIVNGWFGNTYRLLGRDQPSPGFTAAYSPRTWLESEDAAELRVFRAAGSDGALRLRFWTLTAAELEGRTSSATPGTDFAEVSGVLDWSDGDDGDRVIRIPLRRDKADEGIETIYVGFEALTPGSWNARPLVAVAVGDATAASSAGNPPAGGGSRGGGGAFGWSSLLLLAAAAVTGRLRRSRPHAKSRTMQARILQAFACLPLVGAAAAQAVPGDVDPGFHYPDPAERRPDSTTAVRLPDGWLVVQSPAAEFPHDWSHLVLTRTDRDGRIDADYGVLGRRTIDLPKDLNVSTAAKRLADGSVLLGGWQPVASAERSVGAVVRLDPQGRLDPGFGEQGVATIDVNGQMDRVGAIESLPDGRLALLLWSRLESTYYYDCSLDQTALVILDADGRNSRVESAQARTGFGAGSCRNQMTLQLRSDGSPVYGNEVGVFGFPQWLPGNWRYGPFVVDSELGSFFTTVAGTSINVQRSGVGSPAENYDYEDLGDTVGLCGPVTWTRLVADAARQRLYLGLESDGGQVAIARFRVDGSIDTGWGHSGIVPIKGGQCVDWVAEGLASDLRLLSVEPDGAIVVATADGTFQRLAGGAGTAHGAFTPRAPRSEVTEGNYILTVTVPRLGGAADAVSVNYRVTGCDPAAGLECSTSSYWHDARPGEDFVAASGRLDWSDGDTTDRFIRIQLLDDGVAEVQEWFYVELSDPGGGAGLLRRSTKIYIAASDQPVATTPPPTSPPPTQTPPAAKADGGSGSLGPGLLALLLLAAVARPPGRRHVAAASRLRDRSGP